MKFLLRNILLFFAAILFLGSCQKTISSKTGKVKLTFRNMVGSSKMELDAQSYTNPFGESYTLNKFKYYISNVKLGLSGVPTTAADVNGYHLIDESIPGSLSFIFDAEENNFITLSFLIGVDSIRNVSGAQTGALDPLNDMFWTWNSGYIMAKVEGVSPSSNQAGNKFEYHIGGFSGPNSALKMVALTFPGSKKVEIKQGKTSEIFLDADFNKWWQSPNDLKIAVQPVITTPGALAKMVADNYSDMFMVTDVVNQ